jgi:hypothetical protein
MRKNLKKWDAALAREMLANCTGKDRTQKKVLELLRGVYRTTSMVRKIITIHNLPTERRDARITQLKLTEEAFQRLYTFCKGIYDQSWRAYTKQEEEMHYACRAFQALKRERKPLEWVWQLGFLPESERAHTACVIWWDIFAERECTNRFTPFDQWLDGFKPTNFISNEALRKNLVACGYPKLVAERRVLGEDIEETEELETV